jgi:hypothetical protein
MIYSHKLRGRIVMSRSKASGHVLERTDAPIIMGMVARGDRDHDIAAWFGVNQGRIAEVKDGTKFGTVAAASAADLPPKGPPGIKGRRLRDDVLTAIDELNKGDQKKALIFLRGGVAEYDLNER